ncbi:putative odorant receptor 83c [Bradysia coprophila]|uniref:putative odorant receptor 83c n=1 Tax=Bradysia coprophila TaxID=38358 RepID=UPI00187D90CB|nr:putative odorant receptor 83c [Bradysia coprophila]
MEPDDLFYTCVYHWFRQLAQLGGLDIFVDDFKVAPPAYCLISSLYALFLSCVWTIYAYPFDDKLMCCTFLAFCCQGIVKFHSLLKNHKEMKAMCDFNLKVYRSNRDTSHNKTELTKAVNIIVFIFKGGISFLIVTAILTVLKPSITYLLIGKVEPILPTYIPMLNDKELTGYMCLAVFQAYIMFVFVIGTAATDFGLMVLVLQSYTLSQIFRNEVDDFNSLVAKNERNTNTIDVRASLRNLILMHMDFVNFTKTLKLAYHEICLVQITMANTIMIVLLYVILIMDWFPAYFFMATAFFQVFEYSLLGTIFEIANDKMYNAICDITLVYLPVAEQQKVNFMVLNAQKPHLLTIGGFESLNVKTYIAALKRTYSVGMILINSEVQ